jgi:hypothetical protein
MHRWNAIPSRILRSYKNKNPATARKVRRSQSFLVRITGQKENTQIYNVIFNNSLPLVVINNKLFFRCNQIRNKSVVTDPSEKHILIGGWYLVIYKIKKLN